MEPADVHPPRDLHHRVLARVQAHGDEPQARHYDPLRTDHARARHGLRKDVRPPAVEQALRLSTPRRLHPAPARREAGRTSFWRPKL